MQHNYAYVRGTGGSRTFTTVRSTAYMRSLGRLRGLPYSAKIGIKSFRGKKLHNHHANSTVWCGSNKNTKKDKTKEQREYGNRNISSRGTEFYSSLHITSISPFFASSLVTVTTGYD